MTAFIQAHQLIAGFLAMWVIGNAVSAMPTPKDGGGAFYAWFFKFCQPIGAAIPRLMAVYAPNTLTAVTGQSVKPATPLPASDGVKP